MSGSATIILLFEAICRLFLEYMQSIVCKSSIDNYINESQLFKIESNTW